MQGFQFFEKMNGSVLSIGNVEGYETTQVVIGDNECIMGVIAKERAEDLTCSYSDFQFMIRLK